MCAPGIAWLMRQGLPVQNSALGELRSDGQANRVWDTTRCSLTTLICHWRCVCRLAPSHHPTDESGTGREARSTSRCGVDDDAAIPFPPYWHVVHTILVPPRKSGKTGDWKFGCLDQQRWRVESIINGLSYLTPFKTHYGVTNRIAIQVYP